MGISVAFPERPRRHQEHVQPPESFNDAKKYGRHAELFFFLLQTMRRVTDSTEPGGHVSTERAIFFGPFTSLADMRLPARNDPLCQGAPDELPWLCERPQWPRGRPRALDARRACAQAPRFERLCRACTDFLSLKVSAP